MHMLCMLEIRRQGGAASAELNWGEVAAERDELHGAGNVVQSWQRRLSDLAKPDDSSRDGDALSMAVSDSVLVQTLGRDSQSSAHAYTCACV